MRHVFPKEGRGGSPGFISLLHNIDDVWKTQRERVEQSAQQITDALKKLANDESAPSGKALDRSIVDSLFASYQQTFDSRNGGFGGRPKFPPHQALTLMLYDYKLHPSESVLDMINLTLTKMAKGGIYDHVGGGFHRYATDDIWFLPHFEKMLYDNAQLSRVYAEAYEITGNEWYKEVAHGINTWILRDMLDKNGGFHSAYDADSEGEEGKYYLWTVTQVNEVLGEEIAAKVIASYNISEEGNYYEEATRERKPTNIPHLTEPLNTLEQAKELRTAMVKLRKSRDTRIWPMLDDKVLTSWNGMMIGSLAYSGKVLKTPAYIDAAKRAADFILKDMKQADGRLHATYRDGTAKLNAYLDDYSFLANGLLDLYEACDDKKYLEEAVALMEVLEEHFADEKAGGFFFTAKDHEVLLSRNKDPFDGAIPSGNGIAAQVYVRLGVLLDDETYHKKAKASFTAFEPLIAKSPRGATSFVQSIAMYFDHDKTPAVASTPDATERREPVTVSAYLSALRVPPGGTIETAVQFVIDEKWHVYANQLKDKDYIPTVVEIEENALFTAKKTTYPAAKAFTSEILKSSTDVYDASPVFRSAITAKADAKPGTTELVFRIQFQACDEQVCKLPQEFTLKVPISIDPDAKKDARHPGVFTE